MALKGERIELFTDISQTCETTAERGQILVRKTSGSGIALGDSAALAEVSASSSGKLVVGLLMNDVIDLDETLYHRNFHKDVTKKGERCRLLKVGHVTTNKITGTPTAGATAYLSSSGVLTPTVDPNGGLTATPKVGQFDSIKDENGYVKVSINLPIL